MALIADDAADRAEQLILLTERLTVLVVRERELIEARQPPLEGADAEERTRLVNAYRLELARIKQEPAMLSGAPQARLDHLKRLTAKLHEALAAHEISLGAVKLVAEGLVQAMAEEVARQRGGARTYGASGGMAAPAGPTPVTLDRSA